MKRYKLDMEKYRELARQAAAESCVLLKNEKEALPFRKGIKISVFGRSAFHYYKSGTGSGGMVNTKYVIGILDGLKNNGTVILNEKLLKQYREWILENPFEKGEGWGQEPWSQKEMPLSEEIVREASQDSELALIVIGRTAGEDQDTKVEPGSYLLTNTEEEMLEKVCRIFTKTVVILNTGNIIDMKWAEKHQPSAILYVWQGGQEGGNGVADILCGKTSPCGKLTDTIAKDIKDYPSTQNFGNDKSNYYAEDIYVGYRYFETFAKEKVLYPFGYGLSYTDFQVQPDYLHVDKEKLYIDVAVKNIGKYSGKEVVQIYSCAPQGELGKPARELKDYKKTKILAPGEACLLKFCIPLKSLSSYDDSGCTGYKSSYVLESGTYGIYVGTDIRSASPAGEFTIEKLRVVETLEEALTPVKDFNRLSPKLRSISYEKVPKRTADIDEQRLRRRPVELSYTGDLGYVLRDVLDGKITMDTFIAQLDDNDLTCIVRGEGMCSPKVTPGTASAFGGVTEQLAHFGIPIGCCADGPSGIRMDNGMQAFSLPNGTALGCTFDPELVEHLYQMTGMELRKNHIDVLLGPGMNIHRNPLNGRNFEYMSEDPYVTGTMAAAQVRGLQYAGIAGTIKHFAANNQEYNRRSTDSIISERALREIYLKGFEIAVKEGKAPAVMTSYGAINGIWTAGSYELVTTVLRDEWGFDGIVMTDWWAEMNEKGEEPSEKNTGVMVRAQNDLYMVVTDAASNSQQDNSIESLKQGKTTRGEFQRCAANICRMLMNTPAMEALDGKHQEAMVEVIGENTLEIQQEPDYSYYKVGGTTKIPITDICTQRGSSTSFGIQVKDPGNYEYSARVRAEAAELAQMSMSVFCDEQFQGAINLNGTDKEWRDYTVDIGKLQGKHRIRIFFSMDGMQVDEIHIKEKRRVSFKKRTSI